MIRTVENRYNGIIADNDSLPGNTLEFENEIVKLIDKVKDKKLLWIKLKVHQSGLIPILTRHGFHFHHCNENELMLVKKLDKDAELPAPKNFIVGVGAIVLHDNRLLVIKDWFSSGYKLPGGHIDRNESIKNALKREVYEETGIHIAFESIMNIGHFTDGQFGESNLYIVCTAKALSTDISIRDSSEIMEAKWMDPNDFLQAADVNNYNRSVVEAALINKELKLIDRNIKLNIPGGEVFF